MGRFDRLEADVKGQVVEDRLHDHNPIVNLGLFAWGPTFLLNNAFSVADEATALGGSLLLHLNPNIKPAGVAV